MDLARLVPSLQQLAKTRRAVPKGAQPSRLEEKAAKVTAGKKAEAAAKVAVWTRAGGKCERCGKRVTKGLDSLHAGHVHHIRKRSQGGTWNDLTALQLLCQRCHEVQHR